MKTVFEHAGQDGSLAGLQADAGLRAYAGPGAYAGLRAKTGLGADAGPGGDAVGGLDATAAGGEQETWLSMCVFAAGGQRFAMETGRIREVLGETSQVRVPRAPDFIGGVMAYHGEVLTTVSLRALLGLGKLAGLSCALVSCMQVSCVLVSCVLVLEEALTGEAFGVLVDEVVGVTRVDQRTFRPNPSTLDRRGQTLFAGAYRGPAGLLLQLDPGLLEPERLATVWADEGFGGAS